MQKNTGWITLHRSILEWEWYNDINVRLLFLHLILVVNHRDNKWRGILVKRGQKLTSYSNLAEETGLSTKQVRVALNKLKRTGEVASESTSQYTIITIKNYNTYQDKGKPRASEGQASGKRVATNNNDNNEDNVTSNTYDSFIKEFNKIIETEHKGDDKSKRQFSARIKDGYTVDDFIKAITNASKNKYLMGDNDANKRYLTPEYITRPDKLEDWINQKPKDKWAGYKFV